MNTLTYQITFDEEEKYWWHSARREIVRHLRRRIACDGRPLALNIGCGTGGLSLDLAPAARVVSLDIEQKALRFCQVKKLRDLIRANGEQLPITSHTFDEIYALDFLEHLQDDLTGAREIQRCLKPKSGFAVVTVPAFRFLWSKMDEIAHHKQRYRLGEFRQLLLKAGFRIELLSYYNFFLFPLALVFKTSEKKSCRSDDEVFLPTLPGPVNALFKQIFTAEKYFLPWVRFPVGVSLIAILRKDA